MYIYIYIYISGRRQPVWRSEALLAELKVPADITVCQACGATWALRRNGSGYSPGVLDPRNSGYFLGCPRWQICTSGLILASALVRKVS